MPSITERTEFESATTAAHMQHQLAIRAALRAAKARTQDDDRHQLAREVAAADEALNERLAKARDKLAAAQ